MQPYYYNKAMRPNHNFRITSSGTVMSEKYIVAWKLLWFPLHLLMQHSYHELIPFKFYIFSALGPLNTKSITWRRGSLGHHYLFWTFTCFFSLSSMTSFVEPMTPSLSLNSRCTVIDKIKRAEGGRQSSSWNQLHNTYM